MITYIDARLVHWAEWCLRKDDGGLGFPKQSVYTKLTPRDGVRGSHEQIDSEANEIEKAVQALKVESDELHQVVKLTYRRTMTGEQRAEECGCSRDTVYVRLHKAHVWIMNWLQDQPK